MLLDVHATSGSKFESDDFDVRNDKRGRAPKKFENAELKALLDEDGSQNLRNDSEAIECDAENLMSWS